MDEDVAAKFDDYRCVISELSKRLTEEHKRLAELEDFVRNQLAPRVNEHSIE